MNDRIKQLAEQAGIQDNPDQEGLEFFAELIIQECAQACINMGNDYEIKSAGQYQAELFAFAIKKHFGVEKQSTEPSESHTCPYAEEIHNDYETLCDCDEEQTYQCAMDI
jgi:hypothetical protein